MRSGQASIVSYVMLVGVAAFLAVSIFFVFATSSAELSSSMSSENNAQSRLLSSSMRMYAPGAVREGTPFRAVVQNVGGSAITSLSAFIERGGVRTDLNVTNIYGSPIQTLPLDGVGVVTLSPPPSDGDLLVVGGKETYAFRVFGSAVKQVRAVGCGGASLASVDGSGVIVSSSTCGGSNTITCDLGVDPESAYIIAYAQSTGSLSFFTLTDGAGFSADDSVSFQGGEGVYEAGSVNAPGNQLDICVLKTRSDPVLIDYLAAVVFYNP